MTFHMQKSSRRHFCRMSTVSVFATTLGCGTFLNQGVSETLFFSACTDLHQQHYIAAVDTYGQLYFKLPIPFRAHDSVCIETTGQVVFFGRNPGDRFYVVSVEQKKIVREVFSTQHAPFSGHGVLVKNHLYVSENAIHHGSGSIGIYDIEGDFERVGEVSSFGVEPHQIQVLPDQKTLVVANGGLRRDQQLGITNIADFSSNISFISLSSNTLLKSYTAPAVQLSLRHICVNTQGQVYVGAQSYRDDHGPLVFQTSLLESLEALVAEEHIWTAHNKYTASLVVQQDRLAVTSPRGDMVSFWDTQTGQFIESISMKDGAGIAVHRQRFIVSSGYGHWSSVLLKDASNAALKTALRSGADGLSWDNHIATFE